MTYGPPPGWNPNQPQAGPVGGQPGYPQQPGYPPQPGYPQPTGPQQTGPLPTGPQPAMGQQPFGQPAMGQPMPGQQPMGQPMGQFAPYGVRQAGPKSPLPVLAGALALLSFVYLGYVTIIMLLRLIHGSSGLFRLALNTSFVAENHGRGYDTIMTVAVGIVAILFLVGGILLVNRKSSGRVFTVIASVLAIAISVMQIIQNPPRYTNAFDFVVPAIALIALVLCVLPATGQGLRRAQQAGYPQQPPPIGYAQPPGGYQQPPGGMPR